MVGKRKRAKLLDSHQRCWLWGRHALLETLRSGRWQPLEIVFDPDRSDPSLLKELEQYSDTHAVSLVDSTGDRMRQLCGSKEHQGVMARMPPFPYTAFSAFLERLHATSVILILDGIQDPFNFGSILRSADLFGVDAVVVPQQGQSPVTSHVVRSSAGAVGYLDIIQTESLSNCCQVLRSRGITLFAAVEADRSPEGLSRTPMESRAPSACDLTKGLALVIGNEGSGISAEVLQVCDERISIPQIGHVGSLNAAVAAGILCYEVRRQRMVPPDDMCER